MLEVRVARPPLTKAIRLDGALTGDQVFLDTKYIKMLRPSKKLNSKAPRTVPGIKGL